ncbi:hypothetical protein HYALB_00002616 [Hymenoscyphus albidus]|uniref:Zn(2)-C6 fungal-type domain-containing protein n=1 Tax=Hymenoscyphus albidus TaxID=595503 RepID=A0A9N9Q9A4_9HELO|nr:hypothetical protein HYALB_00002616 [Hymenoscyphus albidus]
MSKVQNTSKQRQPKLRASCDGCFLAKVKCSKERPICSRCLTTGAECGYSPSCRTGKSKAVVNSSADHTSTSSPLGDLYEDSAITYTALNHDPHIPYSEDSATFGVHTSWLPLQNQGSSKAHRRSISSTVPSMVRDSSTTPESVSGGSGTETTYETPYPWNPSMRPGNNFHSAIARSKSAADIPLFSTLEPWFEGQNDMLMFGPISNIGPSFQKDPNPFTSNEFMANAPATSCNCFNISLQALQALHNHTINTTPAPSFDVVLSVNRRAIDSCAMMLDCSKCIIGFNSNTSVMLLATIIGKVLAFYRAASQNYFGFNNVPSHSSYQPQPVPLTFGTYKITEEDGRWLEMEILLRELRKLEEVLGKFGEVTRDSGLEDGGVKGAVLGYLRQGLSVTFEVLNMRRGVQQGV